MASDKNESIKVVVRCRPFNQKEKNEGHFRITTIDESTSSVSISNPYKQDEPPKSFTFDYAFGEESKQVDVYNKTVRSVVDSVLEGYNGTVFAYGQTGTGKTFSMQGVKDVPELRGIIPNSFDHIFSHIAHAPPTTKYLVRCSFLEIYNEDIRDLLLTPSSSPSSNGIQKLELKESKESGVYVKDLSSYIVKNQEEIEKLMVIGNRNRSVGATLMNAESSRSHSIFTITIERTDSDAVSANGSSPIRVGKLNLVDLAGSERQSKTGATGDRLKEAAKINLSLTALGNVIASLVDGKSSHVPYRDSKLTRLLQDSLGGNAKTMMLATLSPASYNYDETIGTLRYANRTKMIKNKPKINEDPKDAMLREYQEEIKRLREQLAAVEEGSSDDIVLTSIEDGESSVNPSHANNNSAATGTMNHAGKKKKIHLTDEQIQEMQAKIQAEKEAVLQSKTMVEAERQKLLQEMGERQQELEKERQDRELVTLKLKQMEEKLLVGGVNMYDQAETKALELQRKEAELEEQKRKERELARRLDEQEALHLQIEESYSSLQEEIAAKTKKLKKVWSMLMNSKTEIKDIQEEFQREREELLDTIRALARELKLKSLIVNHFIPGPHLDLIEKNSSWDVSSEKWRIPHIAHAGNNIKGKRSLVSGQLVGSMRRDKVGTDENMDAANAKFDDAHLRIKSLMVFPDVFLTYDQFLDDKKAPKTSKKKPTTAAPRPKSRAVEPVPMKQSKTNLDEAPTARGLVSRSRHYA